jgi:hypothetical protein
MFMKSMKIVALSAVLLILASSACTRKEPADPGDLFGPSSLHYNVEGSASPSVLWVNGYSREITTVRVVVTDYQRKPLAGKMVFFRQMGGSGNPYFVTDRYGYFEDGSSTYRKRTDSNGVVQVSFHGPLELGSQMEFFINALVEDIDQTYTDGPQDFIRIQFIDARQES